MKTYNSPMLQVVSINKKDIIATSDPAVTLGGTFGGDVNEICAPDRYSVFGDGWANAGY